MSRAIAWRRLRALGGSSLIAGSMLLAVSAPASAATAYFPELTGDQAVPGPGDPDANGLAQISIDPANGSACVSWDILDLDPATSAHIQSGVAGVPGPVVVTLPTPDAEGLGGDCVNGLDGVVLQAIVDDPDAYYVAIYTAQSENPAIRGQLGALVEYVVLQVTVVACPAGTQVALDTSVRDAGCASVTRSADVPALQPGYSFDVDPITVDLGIEVDDGAGVLNVDDAQLAGDGTCDTITLLCSVFRGYEWEPVFTGDTAISQLVVPSGYALQSAIVYRGGTATDVLSASGATVTVDTTGGDFIQVTLFDLPASAEGPTTTVPPTSTLDSASPSGGGPGVVLAAVLVVALTVILGLSLAIPRRRRR